MIETAAQVTIIICGTLLALAGLGAWKFPWERVGGNEKKLEARITALIAELERRHETRLYEIDRQVSRITREHEESAERFEKVITEAKDERNRMAQLVTSRRA